MGHRRTFSNVADHGVVPMWQYTKTLFALLVVALFLLPAGALADNNTTEDPASETDSGVEDPSESAECQDWQADADRMAQEFWDGEKPAWHAFIADMDEDARRFFETHPTREEADRWTEEWYNHLHERRGQAQDREEAFHADMRAQAEQYCGDAGYYHEFRWDWPDPKHAQDPSYYPEQAGSGDDAHADDPYGDDPYGDDPYRSDDYAHDTGYSEECRAWEDERRRAFDALHEEFRQRWEALESEWRAFESEEHSEEEWQAFERQMMDRERQLRTDEEAAYRALEEDPPPEGCGYHMDSSGPGPGGHPDDMGDRCDYGLIEDQMRQFEDRIRERKSEFMELQDAKWARFESRMQEQIRQFESEEHSESEWAAFEDHLQAEERRFHERMEQEERAFWDRADQERHEYRQRLEADCHGGMEGGMAYDDRHGGPYDDRMGRGPGPGGPDDYHDDRMRRGPGGPGDHDGFRGGPHFDEAYEAMEIARLECELEIKQQIAAFMREMDAAYEAADGDDHSEAFYAEMDAKRLAFEIDTRKKMLECQRNVQAQWQEKVGDHLDEGRPMERMGSWTMNEDYETGTAELRGTYMTITGDTMANVLTSVAVAGQVWIDGISTDSAFDPESFDMGDDGQASWLKAEGEGVKMRLHDNPSGLIRFRSDDGHSFFLQIPDYLEVTQTGPGWSLGDGEQRALVRVAADSSAWDPDSRVLTVWDKAEFLLPDNADNQVLKKVANKHRGEIMDAVEKHKVGAEITLAANNGDTQEETLVYEDVEVKVEEPETENQVAVTFSADHGEEGKTFVLNIEDQVVRVGGTIDVTYFDIDEETGAETEASISKASSLSDILDATDDDTAEYWIVEDEDGVQVMVSVPNWSTHRVKVQGSEGGIFGAPAPGFGVLGLGALLGAVAVVTLRRKDDDA